jgi:putative ABC transport system permease protein
MMSGEYLDADDANGIIIGRQIAGGVDVESDFYSFHGAQVGEAVKLTVGGVSKDFIIRGIFYTKFINTDQRAFITQAALESMLPPVAGKATQIIVKTTKTGQEDKVIAALEAAGITGKFGTWQDAAGLMKSVTKSFLSINVLMTFVGILIAAVTIFIVIYIDISNKRRQIGIMRAIGIKPYIIRTTYILQTVVYSVAGVALGTALFFGVLVPYFNWHPFALPICDAVLKIDSVDFIARMETVFLVAIGAGLIPAFTVTRMKILNAILGK